VPYGETSGVRVVESTLSDPPSSVIETCVTAAIVQMLFPWGKGGAPFSVQYRFEFPDFAERPEVIELSPVVDNAGYKRQLAKTIDAHRAEHLTPCIDAALENDPALDGRVTIAKVEESTVDAPELERCLHYGMLRIRFDAGLADHDIPVRYPFEVQPVAE